MCWSAWTLGWAEVLGPGLCLAVATGRPNKNTGSGYFCGCKQQSLRETELVEQMHGNNDNDGMGTCA
ncbi:hypothetical protein TIFTF001_004276 [Ficus carica]|uniref:Secreted protein n=1 Tax=Ficus carica TaxID=3494 RepID=A0AA87ZB30_FICCA|nr:hypothetical protein TIFTF001_004276 [Ficus carica]